MKMVPGEEEPEPEPEVEEEAEEKARGGQMLVEMLHASFQTVEAEEEEEDRWPRGSRAGAFPLSKTSTGQFGKRKRSPTKWRVLARKGRKFSKVPYLMTYVVQILEH